MQDLFYFTISELSGLMQSRKISPVEVTKQMLDRIERLDKKYNAFIHVMREEALEDALKAEKEILGGMNRGPLHGVPVAVKDMIQTKGVATTAGSKLFENWIPDEDAAVVVKLKEAGAILIGKANLHEFAMGATSENRCYGTVKNPWNEERIAGGSSGGSAAAVVAGMSYGAIGTDTAGSIRLPAALCGCVGLKPTYGRVSKHGCLPFSWSLDHIGPMARTVKDTAILYKAIAGYDKKDDTTVKKSLSIDNFENLSDLSGWTIGICREYFFEQVDPEIAGVMNQVIEKLGDWGAYVQDFQIPGIHDAIWAQKIIAQAEGYAFHETLLRNKPDLYGEDVKYRLQFGKNVTAHDYLKAQRIRKWFIQQVSKVMEMIDIWVTPMNHNQAFSIGSRNPEQSINNMYDLSKAPLINLLGFPAISVPCGFTGDRMPIGIQFIAKPFQEKKLFQVSHLFEQSEMDLKFIPPMVYI